MPTYPLAWRSELDGALLDTRSIYVIHDQRGRALEFFNQPRENFALTVKEIREAENLGEFFEISSLSEKASIVRCLQKKSFTHNPFFFQIITDLPIATLTSRPIGNKKFLGRISFMDFVPNTFSPFTVDFVYIDIHTDRILGFHSAFHKYFVEKYPDPRSLLGLPASALLSPSPKQVQDTNLSRFDVSNPKGFTKIYGKDFSKEGLDESEELPLKDELSKKNNGLLWGNQKYPNVFITLLQKINTQEQDFVLTVKFKNKSGQGPYFTLGGCYMGEDRLPDDQGYMVGRTHAHDKVMIRKYGLILASAPDPGIVQPEEVLQFCKIGESLLLFQNNIRLTAFYDHRFQHFFSRASGTLN